MIHRMDVLERRHDPHVSVKVSQIDRPSSGLQDLIRTLTGKDYGYSLRIDRKKNDLPAASPDMHGVHDRSARGGMYIHHRLIFLFSRFWLRLFLYPPPASMQEDTLVF